MTQKLTTLSCANAILFCIILQQELHVIFPLKQCNQNDSSFAKLMVKCPAVSFNNACWQTQVKGAVEDITTHCVIIKLIVLHYGG